MLEPPVADARVVLETVALRVTLVQFLFHPAHLAMEPCVLQAFPLLVLLAGLPDRMVPVARLELVVEEVEEEEVLSGVDLTTSIPVAARASAAAWLVLSP